MVEAQIFRYYIFNVLCDKILLIYNTCFECLKLVFCNNAEKIPCNLCQCSAVGVVFKILCYGSSSTLLLFNLAVENSTDIPLMCCRIRSLTNRCSSVCKTVAVNKT